MVKTLSGALYLAMGGHNAAVICNPGPWILTFLFAGLWGHFYGQSPVLKF